jgi:hypothetical protein
MTSPDGLPGKSSRMASRALPRTTKHGLIRVTPPSYRCRVSVARSEFILISGWSSFERSVEFLHVQSSSCRMKKIVAAQR